MGRYEVLDGASVIDGYFDLRALEDFHRDGED